MLCSGQGQAVWPCSINSTQPRATCCLLELGATVMHATDAILAALQQLLRLCCTHRGRGVPAVAPGAAACCCWRGIPPAAAAAFCCC